MGHNEDDVERLYQEARSVRVELEALWTEAQATDVAVKGAVSAALTDDLSESERGFAVSFGLQRERRARSYLRSDPRFQALLRRMHFPETAANG